MKLTVNLQIASEIKQLPDKSQLRRWIKAALENEIENAEITIRIVDEPESAVLNQRYRKKTGPTNVLSFNLNNNSAEKSELQGDLVLCAPVVAKEVHNSNKTLATHWAHLVIHGTLHLQGYDHEKANEAKIMENKERQIMSQLGFSDPYSTDHAEEH